ncbi:hypothetical protein DIPPA_12495 [Diplonema papillatum]|nr:hypothetical protein DIPPA_12495 [Diplonema papillatum]
MALPADLGVPSTVLAVLEREQVDAESLLMLTEDDLKELGVPLGPRKLILRYIAAEKAKPTAKQQPAAPPAPPASPAPPAPPASTKQPSAAEESASEDLSQDSSSDEPPAAPRVPQASVAASASKKRSRSPQAGDDSSSDLDLGSDSSSSLDEESPAAKKAKLLEAPQNGAAPAAKQPPGELSVHAIILDDDSAQPCTASLPAGDPSTRGQIVEVRVPNVGWDMHAVRAALGSILFRKLSFPPTAGAAAPGEDPAQVEAVSGHPADPRESGEGPCPVQLGYDKSTGAFRNLIYLTFCDRKSAVKAMHLLNQMLVVTTTVREAMSNRVPQSADAGKIARIVEYLPSSRSAAKGKAGADGKGKGKGGKDGKGGKGGKKGKKGGKGSKKGGKK